MSACSPARCLPVRLGDDALADALLVSRAIKCWYPGSQMRTLVIISLLASVAFERICIGQLAQKRGLRRTISTV